MDGMRTLGQAQAVAAARSLLAAGMPHAVLLAGPTGVGKTTLAMDIAAALLCRAEDASARPCRSCRSCRMVEHGNHPDLHLLAPSGAGGMISIGGRGERGVRDLVGDLALLPVEGGARIALVESADRMSDDAQSAFLKTLEEPPPGTTILLCADDEERMLPTIRSRCARIRLGTMGSRGVEAVLTSAALADAPTAARLARITDGRPGHAVAYARAPEAATIRDEIARTLLDLLDAGVTARLTGMRALAGRASDLLRALETGAERASVTAALGGGAASRARARGRQGAAAPQTSEAARGRLGSDAGGAGAAEPPTAESSAAELPSAELPSAESPATASDGPAARVPAAERRRSALALVAIWRAVLRDVALLGAGAGAEASIRDLALLDDLRTSAPRLAPAAATRLLAELDVAGERLEGNVSPELVLDVLALRWVSSVPARGPRPGGTAR